jgi:hypothetical protein
MITSMEKHRAKEREAIMEELLKDKEKIYAAVKNSPFLKRKNEEAAASLAKLPRPFPWEKAKSEDKS